MKYYWTIRHEFAKIDGITMKNKNNIIFFTETYTGAVAQQSYGHLKEKTLMREAVYWVNMKVNI